MKNVAMAYKYYMLKKQDMSNFRKTSIFMNINSKAVPI